MRRIETVNDINNLIAEGNTDYLFMLSEAYQDRCIVQIAAAVQEQDKKVILIAGPSSSGKTTTAKKLCLHLDAIDISPVYLGTDDYFLDRDEIPFDEEGKQDFESLSAIDIDLFNRQLSDLLSGKEADIPTFNFMNGKKEFGKRKVKLLPGQKIVIEGIHALNDALTPLIKQEDKFKVYVCPEPEFTLSGKPVAGEDLRKIRRSVRDFAKRGWSVKETLDRWESVVSGEKVFIFPFRDSADIIFNTALPYEVCVLRKHIEPLLEGVEEGDEHYQEAQRLLGFVRKFTSIEDDSMIEADSIIREFIGGSIIDKIL